MEPEFLNEEEEEKCPICGQFTGGDDVCPNCGAILRHEDEFNGFDDDESSYNDDF